MKIIISELLQNPFKSSFKFCVLATAIYFVAIIYKDLTAFPTLVTICLSFSTFLLFMIYTHYSQNYQLRKVKRELDQKSNQLEVVESYLRSNTYQLNKAQKEIKEKVLQFRSEFADQRKARKVAENYTHILENRIKEIKADYEKKESALSSDIAAIKNKIGATQSGKKRTINAIINLVGAKDEELASEIQKRFLD